MNLNNLISTINEIAIYDKNNKIIHSGDFILASHFSRKKLFIVEYAKLNNKIKLIGYSYKDESYHYADLSYYFIENWSFSNKSMNKSTYDLFYNYIILKNYPNLLEIISKDDALLKIESKEEQRFFIKKEKGISQRHQEIPIIQNNQLINNNNIENIF